MAMNLQSAIKPHIEHKNSDIEPIQLGQEDSALIEGCIKNQRVYQEKLYRKFFPTMHRMCLKYTQDEDEILTIMNDGFLKIFTKIDQYNFSGSFEGWIRRIVFHSLSDYFRKKNKEVKFMDLDGVDQPQIDNQLDTLYLEDIKGLLQKLPETTRQVFVKYHIEGYNHAEIGTLLHIAEGTSKWHLSQARKILKDLIEHEK